MMENKKAQVEPVPLVMGIIGSVLALMMASKMGSGIIMKMLTTVITGVVCYFVSLFLSE
jgi:uncharacterized membrane protein YeaQ/YmgE (transglycosylase-associated protein family)